MMKFFQKLGKALMLPVCVLPICGILMGLGYALCPNAIQGGDVSGVIQIIGYYMVKAGSAVIDNMSVLFVIGVALGMSDDGDGAAVLAGIVSWLVITTLLSTTVLSAVFKGVNSDSTIYIAFSKIKNPTIGMLAGLIGAGCYNRFKSTRLPDYLAFFSGKRSVSIVTVLVSIIVSAILAFVWPAIFGVMVKFGNFIASLGGVGCGIYAFLNRLLIPTGMHHALNNVFWFDTIGLGDLTNYWKGKTSADVGWSLGMYMSGFFPCMIGGVPGAALAIYKCAKDKKKALGVLGSTALCAFLCGLTEPFEFSFMFLCFPLYVVYSVLYGLFSVLTYFVGFRAGFSFSAGLVDLVFSSALPAAQKTWLIIPLSILAFVVFYLVFRFVITKFNLATVGREADAEEQPAVKSGSDEETKTAKGRRASNKKEGELAAARAMLKAVGGKDNVVGTDCCATRLRLELKDSSVVDRKLAIDNGAISVICPSKTSCQIIIGTTVQQMLDAFRKVLKETPAEEKKAEKKIPTGPITAHGQLITLRLKRAGRQYLAGRQELADREESADRKDTAGKTDDQKPAVLIQNEEDGSISFTYTIKDPSGIHARPAGQLTQLVKECGLEITVEANGKTAKGTSLVQMMGLGAVKGTLIKVRIEGDLDDARAAASKLSSYISSNL